MKHFVASRGLLVLVLLSALSGLIAFDVSNSKPLNPYSAPAAIAFGSNEVAEGAFCAIVPRDPAQSGN